MNEINQILVFMIEVERLKSVLRKTRPVGLLRFENSAEHSWHVCLSALMFKDYANESVDIDRVVKMLLIHDLGEIDAGDKIIYASETVEQKSKEEAGVRRLLQMLPDGHGDEYIKLWREFEAGETADAKYAKAIDRIPPLLHNLHGDGHSWKTHKIPKEDVFALNGSRISAGSQSIWNRLEQMLNEAVADGRLD